MDLGSTLHSVKKPRLVVMAAAEVVVVVTDDNVGLMDELNSNAVVEGVASE